MKVTKNDNFVNVETKDSFQNYVCINCKKRFISQLGLIGHMKNRHRNHYKGKMRLMCTLCNKNVFYLDEHIDPLRVIVSLADIDSAHNTGGKWHFEYCFKKINNKSHNGKYYFQHR